MDDSENQMELETRIADFLARSAAYLGMVAGADIDGFLRAQRSLDRRRMARLQGSEDRRRTHRLPGAGAEA